MQMWRKPYIFGSKNDWGMQSKMVFVFSLYNPMELLAILYPKSHANLVVEVETRQNHQIYYMVVIDQFQNIIK